jgi:hypothetical protein
MIALAADGGRLAIRRMPRSHKPEGRAQVSLVQCRGWIALGGLGALDRALAIQRLELALGSLAGADGGAKVLQRVDRVVFCPCPAAPTR